ncbi:MAG: hypothetical protein ACK4UX_06915 [Thiobacillus sp.]
MRNDRFARLLAAALCALGATLAHADLPDYQVLPADGTRLLLWVSDERGRTPAELDAAEQLAAHGVETWSLDLANAYFLPQLPRSLDQVPVDDLVAWLRAAQSGGKSVTVYAVARAAVPLLRAAAALERPERERLCMMLMYPNLYTVAEPLAEPEYLNFGRLAGLRVHVLQPRRSAATPWLPGLLDSLSGQGAAVRHVIWENLRERYWMRETPTDFEIAESRRLHERLLKELEEWGCR